MSPKELIYWLNFVTKEEEEKKTWTNFKETIRRIKSWSRNRSFIGLTSWPEEEDKEDMDDHFKETTRRIQSWGWNRSFIGLTSCPEEEEEDADDHFKET